MKRAGACASRLSADPYFCIPGLLGKAYSDASAFHEVANAILQLSFGMTVPVRLYRFHPEMREEHYPAPRRCNGTQIFRYLIEIGDISWKPRM